VLTRYQRRHLHVNMAPLTVEDRLLEKTLQTEKKLNCWQKDCWVSSKTVDCTICDALQHTL